MKESEFKIKLEKTKDYIKEMYEVHKGNIFVSFSGGKDSTVLLHLVRNIYPEVDAVFCNTTNEDKDILKFVSNCNNIITVTPKMNFKEVVEKYGFPLVSKEVAQKANELKHTKSEKVRDIRLNGYPNGSGKLPKKWRFLVEQEFDVTHKCCNILKKQPIERWAKKNGNKIPLIALLAEESALRKQLALYGKNKSKVYPFLNCKWSKEDIELYIQKYKIKLADCYYDREINGVLVKAEERTGCIFCGFGVHLEKENRFEKQKLKNPKRYKRMMILKNNGVTFKDAINLVLKRGE